MYIVFHHTLGLRLHLTVLSTICLFLTSFFTLRVILFSFMLKFCFFFLYLCSFHTNLWTCLVWISFSIISFNVMHSSIERPQLQWYRHCHVVSTLRVVGIFWGWGLTMYWELIAKCYFYCKMSSFKVIHAPFAG